MIYLLYGSDVEKSWTKLRDLVATMLAKKPDASHTRMTDENFDESKLDEFIGSSGLFSAKMIVEVSNVFRNKEAKEVIVKRLKEIAESENVFIFLEGDLDKKTLEKFEKHAVKVQKFDAGVRGEKVSAFNMFALADAFARRDKKNLWVLYAKASRLDVPAEGIHGLLFWQVKTMLLAESCKSAEEAGMKDYSFRKAKSSFRNFKPGEVQKISSKLVSMYHHAHRGLIDFDSALEKFILEV